MLKHLRSLRWLVGLLLLFAWLAQPYVWWAGLHLTPRKSVQVVRPLSPGIWFSEDGGTFHVYDDVEQVLSYWDTATCTQLFAFDLKANPGVNSRVLACLADGKVLVSEVKKTGLQVRDRDTGKELAFIPGGPFKEYLCSPDGSKLLTATNKNESQLWDLKTGKLCFCFATPRYCESHFSPGGQWLTTYTRVGGFDWQAQVHDTRSGEMKMEHAGRWPVCLFSADGTKMVRCEEGSASLWDCRTWNELLRIQLRDTLVDFSHDGSLVAVAVTIPDPPPLPNWVPEVVRRHWESQDAVQLVEVGTSRQLASIPGERDARFSPDGKTLAIFHLREGIVHLWDVPPKTLVPSWAKWPAGVGALLLTAAWWRMGRRARKTSPNDAIKPAVETGQN